VEGVGRLIPAVNWRDTTVLVTGGAGFLGAWLVERLVDEGAEVVVARRDCDPASRFTSEGIEARCSVAHADVTDYDAVLSILNDHDVQAVFHLAAQPIVPMANRSPLSTFESNVRGTYALLEACRARGVIGSPLDRIVVASTDHAYGTHENLPYREDYQLIPSFPYDVSKACADMIARCYAERYALPIAVTRLANLYGGGDRNWSRIVPDTARALVEGRPLIIRSDGTPERDFLYVEDAVEAYLAIAASLDDPAFYGRAWNAGWGKPIAMLDLVRRMIGAAGKRMEPEVQGVGTPHAEIDRQFLDASAIRAELGWEPRFDLDAGLARAYAWYEDHLSATSANPAALSGGT
jgi:CDP-glucose 4,6-dehydratase